MANVAGMATSFKVDLQNGVHAFSSAYRAADVFKAALYYASASPAIVPATSSYTVTGEVVGANYVAGGVVVQMAVAPTSSGTSAFVTPSAPIIFTNITAAAFDTVMIYNNSAPGKNVVAIYTIPVRDITAGTFILSMPINAAGTALIGIN